MSGPIQVIPPGLLGMLQLKNEGRSPSEFIETLQPTIELFEWLLQTNSIEGPDALSGTIAAGLQGFFPATNFVSGQREWHWVHCVSFYSTPVAAGVFFDCRIAFRKVVGAPSAIHNFGDQKWSMGGIAGATSVAWAQSKGFFVPPNMQYGIQVLTNTTALATGGTFNLLYTPLPI